MNKSFNAVSPSFRGSQPRVPPRSHSRRSPGSHVIRISGGLLAAILRVLRFAAFFLMLAVRPLVLLAASTVAPIALLCGLAYGFLRGWSSLPCLVLLGTTLAITVVVFVYHLVLARIGPDGFDLYF